MAMAAGIARAFGQEIPPVMCSPTPFQEISQTLVVEVKDTTKAK